MRHFTATGSLVRYLRCFGLFVHSARSVHTILPALNAASEALIQSINQINDVTVETLRHSDHTSKSAAEMQAQASEPSSLVANFTTR